MKKFKWWFAWQDEQHGAWLQAMAARGLHLRAVNLLGIHTFARGAPAQVAYRWDFHPNNVAPDYRQLLEDAGWEYVAADGGWHCWRKPVEAGRTPEIFTDPADKLRRYRRLLRPCLAMVAGQVLQIGQWTYEGRAPWALTALDGASLAIGLLAAYSAVHLGRRIAALKPTA